MSLRREIKELAVIILLIVLLIASIFLLAKIKNPVQKTPTTTNTLNTPINVEQTIMFIGSKYYIQQEINQWLLENYEKVEIIQRLQSPNGYNQSGVTITIFYKRKP